MVSRTLAERDAYCLTLFTKDRLMACLKIILHEDVYLAIWKENELVCLPPTRKLNIKEIFHYLELLMEIPERRLQSYCKTTKDLLQDLMNCSQTPLFYKYTKQDIPKDYLSDEFLVVDFPSSTKVVAKQAFVHLLYRHLKRVISEKRAAGFVRKYNETLENCYELVNETCVGGLDSEFQNCRNIEQIKKKLEDYNGMFSPSPSRQGQQSPPHLRVFHHDVGNFCFVKDVDVALGFFYLQNRVDQTYPNNWLQEVQHDNEEDRKMGVVHTMEIKTVKLLFEKLGLQWCAVPSVDCRLETYRKYNSFPMVSPYFTHCKLAVYAYQEVIDHLVMELRVFQRVKDHHKDKIKPFLNKLNTIFDSKRQYRYAVEQWKIDELIEEANNLMRKFLTQPVYNVPVKEFFTKRELEEEIKKFSPINKKIEMFVYYHLEEETKNFGPEYSYYDVCEALLMGTSGYIRIDKPLGTFYLIQNHICDTTTDYSVYTAKLTQYIYLFRGTKV